MNVLVCLLNSIMQITFCGTGVNIEKLLYNASQRKINNILSILKQFLNFTYICSLGFSKDSVVSCACQWSWFGYNTRETYHVIINGASIGSW